MLQGTLDVFSLDEVLGLLSGANKSGVLNITGDRGVGTVSIADGQLVGGSVSSAAEASELYEILFELLRYEEGSFSFDGGASVEGDPHDLASVTAKAHLRFDEWKAIEAVVPSLDHHLVLAETLSTSQVTLSESEWATVVAIGEGASVGVVAHRLGLGEFDGSKRVKSLIERSLAIISESAPNQTAPPADKPAVEMPVFATPEPAPASFASAVATIEEAPADTEPAPVEVVAEHGVDTAGLASEFSFESVAAEAPAFEDAADIVADEIPPMPEAPAFGAVEDTEVPPMPEPPSDLPDVADDSVPPPPAPPAPEPAVAEAAPFGGLDPIQSSDMFEPPRRSEDRSSDAFGGAGFDQRSDREEIAGTFAMEPELDAPMPPPPSASAAAPSFDPPADFDAAAFETDTFETDAFGSPEADAEVEAEAEASSSNEKGGSLLMRYLKSNG